MGPRALGASRSLELAMGTPACGSISTETPRTPETPHAGRARTGTGTGEARSEEPSHRTALRLAGLRTLSLSGSCRQKCWVERGHGPGRFLQNRHETVC